VQFAKVLNTPNGQTVLLPQHSNFDSAQVEIQRIGTSLLLSPINESALQLQAALDTFELNLNIERNQPNW
jgi:virulence-associated protein VagC